jgi:hypothetical protein
MIFIIMINVYTTYEKIFAQSHLEMMTIIKNES